jgi:hypothetical protein
MKQILLLFIAVITFCSCEKKYNYECRITTEMNPEGVPFTLKRTEDEINKFMKDNTHSVSGGPTLVVTTCIKK